MMPYRGSPLRDLTAIDGFRLLRVSVAVVAIIECLAAAMMVAVPWMMRLSPLSEPSCRIGFCLEVRTIVVLGATLEAARALALLGLAYLLPPDLGRTACKVLSIVWLASVVWMFCVLPTSALGVETWARYELAGKITTFIGSFAIASLLIALLRLSRAIGVPTTGWLHVAILGSISGGMAMEWAGVSVLGQFQWCFHAWRAMVLALAMSFGVLLPVRRWLRYAKRSQGTKGGDGARDLPALSRALLPFAAAVGAKVAFVTVASAAVFSDLVNGTFGKELLPYRSGEELVCGAFLLVGIIALLPRSRRALGPFALWAVCLSLDLAVYASGTSDGPLSHLVIPRLVCEVGVSLGWIGTALRLLGVLDATIVQASLSTEEMLPKRWRALIVPMGIAPVLLQVDILRYVAVPLSLGGIALYAGLSSSMRRLLKEVDLACLS
jgi:hypothetical protein